MTRRVLNESITNELGKLAEAHDLSSQRTAQGDLRITLADEHSTALVFKGVNSDEMKLTLEFYPGLPSYSDGTQSPGTVSTSAQKAIVAELLRVAAMVQGLQPTFVSIKELTSEDAI